jgi:anti-sigma factor RsiW
MIDERIEHLINRKLDGELTDAESLELDKAVIRDPRARLLLEEYERLDGAAHAAIQATLAGTVPAARPEQITEWSITRRPWWASTVLITAVAASMTLAVLLGQRSSGLVDPAGPAGPMLTAPPAAAPHSGFDLVSHVDGPRRETRSLDRDVIGVWDRDSRSLYLLEVDSARAVVEPTRVNY